MKKLGFLFGAGAEIAYGLPSGGRFALDIFMQDPSLAKQKFKEMRDSVDASTVYASQWLPENYKGKTISSYGKTVFQSVITSTIEHRRKQIIKIINSIDECAELVVRKLSDKGINVKDILKELNGREVEAVNLKQEIAYNDSFQEGNKLFESSYFSSLLLAYRDVIAGDNRVMLGKILLSIMQLQLGALSENLTRTINDNLFRQKDDRIDIFDDFGELIQLNYTSTGVLGLELLFEKKAIDINTPDTPDAIVVRFARLLMEDIYTKILDYKSLIDSNWCYLYNPSSDWAKFCKIAIFLLSVHLYIDRLGQNADQEKENGYYNMLLAELQKGEIEATAIATTNYNTLIQKVLKDNEITHFNGSVSTWYDPYLNKIGTFEELDNEEHHIVVPLLFTQSGTKPMTSINMTVKYADIYEKWKNSDAVVTVGFGFGRDDEHINGILRTLVDDDNRQLLVVTLAHDLCDSDVKKIIKKKLKISNMNNIKVLLVDKEGLVSGRKWTECLVEN